MGIITGLCETVLTAVQGYITEDGTLEQYNEYYVAPGKPSFECTGAAITWASELGQDRVGLPKLGSSSRVINAAVKAVKIHLTVLECVAVQDDLGHPPSLQQYADDSRLIYDRAEVIYSGLLCDVVRRTMWEGTIVAQNTAETALSEWKWSPPSGAMLAGECSLIVQLQR